MTSKKTQLALGVASAALITGLAAPAQAACTMDGDTVTCTADSTAAEVNAAMAAVASNDVTLTVQADATVMQPGGDVFPGQQGTVEIDNAGDLGEDAARVGILYVGNDADELNTFGLDNSGSVSGRVQIYSVGGDINIENSGLLGNGVIVATASDAAVDFTSTGDIDSDFNPGVEIYTRGDIALAIDGNVGTPATDTADSDLRDVIAGSQQFVSDPATTTTETTGTATTTTTTSGYGREGGSVAVAIGEAANTGAITAYGLEGASVSIDGTAGSETQYSPVSASSSTLEGSTTTVTTVDGADSSTVNTSATTAIGGTASVAVGETGSVSGFVSANGRTGADVEIDGLVGTTASPAGAFATSNATDSANTDTSSSIGTVFTSTTDQSSTSVGGLAAVSVGESGTVTGGVSANGVGGAEVVVNGTVGLADAPSFLQATSSGSANTFTNEFVFDGATGASTYAEVDTSASNGGAATVELSDTATAFGSVDAFANGDASVANAGVITGSVSAFASGSENENGLSSESDGAGSSSSASYSRTTQTGGSASIANAAGGLIGLDATAPVSVNANGDTAASVSNAGRINGNVFVQSDAFENQNANASSFTTETDATTGVVTTVNTSEDASSSVNLGGDASLANAAGGLVTGSVSVTGTGSSDVVNEGAVIGTTFAQSQATDTAFSRTLVETSVFVPGADGGTTVARTDDQTYSEVSSGGDVTGVYAGTNGAVQFAPFGGASDGSISQFANGDSTALVSGTIFGNFTGNATGSDFGWVYADVRETTFDADGDQRSFDRAYTYDETNRQADSSSSLAVDGGRLTGNASLYATGSSSAQIGDGGTIEGSLDLTTQGFGGYDYAETYALSQDFDEDGVFVGSSETFTESLQRVVNSGDVSVAIGEGSVAGSVTMNGAGGANSFALAADGTVGGSVSQISSYGVYGYDRTQAEEITADGTTYSDDRSESTVASGGDVMANVAGSIGNGDLGPQAYGDVASAGGTDLLLFTDAGDAEATVTGQVRDGIAVFAGGSDTTFAYQRTTVDGLNTAYAEQSSSTATGGAASLVVDAAELDTPANFGDIDVIGRSGSSVSIGSDSSVLAATNGANMQVGAYFSDTASTREDTYEAGVLTSQVETFSSSVVGGGSSLTNDGRIGFDGGAAFDGDDAFVTVISPTLATATNNGQIFGSIALELAVRERLLDHDADGSRRCDPGRSDRHDLCRQRRVGHSDQQRAGHRRCRARGA